MNCAHKTSACQAGRMAALPAPPILARACTSDTGGRLSAKRLEASCAISDALRNTHERTSPDRDSVRARTPARSAQRQGTTRGRNRPRPRKRDEAMTQTTTAPRTLEGTKGLRNAPPVGALPTAQGGTQAPGLREDSRRGERAPGRAHRQSSPNPRMVSRAGTAAKRRPCAAGWCGGSGLPYTPSSDASRDPSSCSRASSQPSRPKRRPRATRPTLPAGPRSGRTR